MRIDHKHNDENENVVEDRDGMRSVIMIRKASVIGMKNEGRDGNNDGENGDDNINSNANDKSHHFIFILYGSENRIIKGTVN